MLLSKLWISYYPEADGYIRDKVEVVLDLTNWATKEELENTTGVDKSNLAAKKGFVPLKDEDDKADSNKLVNVPIAQK